jgi:hypothetical protein
MARRLAPLLLSLAVACGVEPSPRRGPSPAETSAAAPAPTATASAAPDAAAPDAAAPDPDADGDDDPADTGGEGPLPDDARFERVGRAPLALRRICDLTSFDGALYAAHANEPLDMDGATITRYQPERSGEPFSVAFDWNRPGEPTRNGGGGQGFLRVHAIGGRLYVPDADPPYNGFGITEKGTEGFVFVSDGAGAFAPPRMPHHLPPDPPNESRPGAGVLPRAYHVLDVIRYRGRLYASTGSVPPTERAWHGASPGALHVASDDLSRWTYETDYPYPWKDGVWRLTYLVRFRGRLYAGLQDYDGSDDHDYVVFNPAPGARTITHRDMHPVRATDRGGHRTLRWYADGGKLYWIAVNREGTTLRVTEDGTSWRAVALPRFAGQPTDITRFRGALVVLAERGLYRIDQDQPSLVGRVSSPDGRTPFERNDLFCAAPLAVHRGELYAGGQRDGALYRLSPATPSR